MHISQRKREAEAAPACRRGRSGGSDSLTGASGAPRRCEPVGLCRRLPQQHDGMRRSRTYGPLIKSGKSTGIRTARCCEGFPVYC